MLSSLSPSTSRHDPNEPNYKEKKKMKIAIGCALALTLLATTVASAQVAVTSAPKVMDGFPPSKESQVTFGNYRQHPYSQWAFAMPARH